MKQKDQSEITAMIEKLKQKPQLNRHERRYLTKLESKLNQPKISSSFPRKNIFKKLFISFVVLSVVVGLFLYIKSLPNLPPIDMTGHIEENPSAHILNKEMPESIQKHMLEHADGKGKPSILIQYNCKKYNCEKGLIEKLKVLVKKYPENVYLAPNNYDGKIIITKLNQRKIISAFDEGQIVDFITNK